jgi:LCP family protein required for cell wall assembly
MNLRKFYLILTAIVSVVLFFSGIGVLYYVNSQLLSSQASADTSSSSIKQIFEPLMQSKEPFNVLLLGGDKVNKNSDTMMLANFDPATYKVNIMSIPRDNKVKIDGKTRKINFAFPHGGVDLTVQTVSELLDVNIKYYAFVDTAAFRDIIDLLGGVDYYVPADMNYDDPTQNLHIHLKKGQQRLNGAESEQFIRFRHPNKWTKEIKEFYDGSDLKRTEAQQDFLKELMRQKLNLQYLPKLNSIISVAFENLETNFTLNEIIKMTGYVSKFKVENLAFIPMPGKPYDSSPWYYLCDVENARLITAESFKCADSFVNVDTEVKDYYKNAKSEPDTVVTKKPQTKSTTKNNPSNSDSEIKGNDKQDP